MPALNTLPGMACSQHRAVAPEPQHSAGAARAEWKGPRRVESRTETQSVTTNYLACLLRSVTLTLPRTRLKYNLRERETG